MTPNKREKDAALVVLVVDDHAVVRRGTMDILADMPREFRFLEAATSAEALALVRAHPCGLVLLDLSLPDESGFATLAAIRGHDPELPVIILSMHVEAEYARRALALSANGYLGKNSAPGELAQAIEKVLCGETYVSPGLSGELTTQGGPGGKSPRLSPREREVMHRLARGEKLTDVAAAMRVTVQTAGTYRTRIMKKLNLRTTADFFRYALEKDDILP
ncbi:response regulator transcription factor [Desulfovibrio sulfodismutans]|uniref:Response regulator transcription factor n=1 Tax=Desulfolutivibrio sulfodismutans TaxID=63561 RepID=A0A7K3NQK5_9BACT|nr:response regulator transcription factor [Desulfolutivibrio sulfodismutans]NDY58367.1 response regulator transcription factor [Desulfolutivibrio sulfodismutans]QLA13770.1 response regulator [Desulfolutivibrio sulfodismutans DSM 3696]